MAENVGRSPEEHQENGRSSSHCVHTSTGRTAPVPEAGCLQRYMAECTFICRAIYEWNRLSNIHSHRTLLSSSLIKSLYFLRTQETVQRLGTLDAALPAFYSLLSASVLGSTLSTPLSSLLPRYSPQCSPEYRLQCSPERSALRLCLPICLFGLHAGLLSLSLPLCLFVHCGQEPERAVPRVQGGICRGVYIARLFASAVRCSAFAKKAMYMCTGLYLPFGSMLVSECFLFWFFEFFALLVEVLYC